MGLPFEVAEAILKEEAEKRLEDFKIQRLAITTLVNISGKSVKNPIRPEKLWPLKNETNTADISREEVSEIYKQWQQTRSKE